MPLDDLKTLSPKEAQVQLVLRLREKAERDRRKAFEHWFPEETHDWRGHRYYDRDLYPRHLDFFAAGKQYRERCFLAGNRIGKTITGAYETTCHLINRYPKWWKGYRPPLDNRSIRAWAAGKTNETTRDIIQTSLLGPVAWVGGRKTVAGTGMIPGAAIGSITWKQGVADMVDTVTIHNINREGGRIPGRSSTLGFKSYQQGRGSFEGTAQHLIWLDEEPPLDVYSECLTRTATTNGRVLCTFTPLEGLSEVTMRFMPNEETPE
jgi:phage terminase large subunit-like protein